jgi:hypothetical protein
MEERADGVAIPLNRKIECVALRQQAFVETDHLPFGVALAADD